MIIVVFFAILKGREQSGLPYKNLSGWLKFTINNRKNKLVKSKQDNNFLPIIAIFLMFLLLSIIFNFIKKKKV